HREDYGFGWLVPAFVAFVVYDRWSRITAGVEACRAAGSARTTGWRRVSLAMLAGGALVGGALLFLLGAFYRAGAGPSHPGSLALSLGTAAIVLGLLFVNAPESPTPAPSLRTGFGADPRVQ